MLPPVALRRMYVGCKQILSKDYKLTVAPDTEKGRKENRFWVGQIAGGIGSTLQDDRWM